MNNLIAVVALLVVIVAGMVFAINKGGETDRDVPGRTTDSGTNKLGK